MNETAMRILSYAMLVWRRRWQVVILASIICAVGWVVTLAVPNGYEARTRIYVDTDSLLSPLMRGMTVDVNMGRQVEIMQRTLLSRPNMENVLRMTDLDVTAHSPLEREALLRNLTDRTTVRADGHNLFSVSFTHEDPRLALRVVQALVTIFVESNLGNTRRDMEQARRFIDEQVAQYQRELKRMEQRMAAFKQEHVEVLPLVRNYTTNLEQLRRQVATTRDEVEDAKARRGTVERELKTVPRFIDVQSAPQVVIREAEAAAKPTEQELRIADVQRRIDDLLQRYTEQHPDVVAAKRMLQNLKEQQELLAGAQLENRTAKPAQLDIPKQSIANVVYEQLRLKLIDAETSVEAAERRLVTQQAELARLEKLARVAPEIEAEAISLDRDYDVIKKNYEELLGRREAAKLSQEMDTKSDKVQFRIIDPPFVPQKPSSPNRPLFASIALVGGLGGGFAWGFLRGQIAEPISSVNQLRSSFSLPVLGGVSTVDTSERRRRRYINLVAFGATLLVLFGIYAAVLLLILMDPDRTTSHLEAVWPFLQQATTHLQPAIDAAKDAIKGLLGQFGALE